jgi:hypothetical protein
MLRSNLRQEAVGKGLERQMAEKSLKKVFLPAIYLRAQPATAQRGKAMGNFRA